MAEKHLPSEAYELGELLAEYKTTSKQLGLIGRWLPPAFSIIAGAVLMWKSASATGGYILFVIGLILAMIAMRKSADIRVAYVFTGGLINTRARQNEVIRWHEIAAARMRLDLVAPERPSLFPGEFTVGGRPVEPILSCTLQLNSGRTMEYPFDLEQALSFSQHIHDHLAERKFSSSLKKEQLAHTVYRWEYDPVGKTGQEERAPTPAELIEQLSKR
jgi:hypothetical protein